MKEKKIFSVVIPAYKGEEVWTTCIASVLAQDYPAIELIFSDDGTLGFDSEPIRQFVEKNKHENLVRYEILCQNQNVGTVKNLRAAHEKCTGYYLTHIAADDAYCSSEVLSRYVEALEQKADDVQGVYACSQVCDEEMMPLGYVSFDTEMAHRMNTMSANEQFGQLCRGCCIHMGATAFVRSEFMTNGDFDTDYRLIEDWPYFLKATREGRRFVFLPLDAIYYRNGGVTNASFDTPTKKICCKDHIMLYEKLILPYMRKLPYKDQLAVYGKYAEDRMDMECIFGSLSELGPPQKWKYALIYFPAEAKRLFTRKKKLCVCLFGGIAILLCFGQELVVLLYALLVIVSQKVRTYLSTRKKKSRIQ